MRPVLVWASAVWTLGHGAVYVAVVRDQGGEPAGWYLVLLLGAALLLGTGAMRPSRAIHGVALVVLAGCVVLGILSR